MALRGAASISGVPDLGLPKINNLVGGIFIPAFSASPLWSMIAKSITPWLAGCLLIARRFIDGMTTGQIDDAIVRR